MINFENLNYNFYFFFVFLFLVNLFILKLRFKISNYLGINDIPNSRKIHNQPTPLIGGVCFFTSLIILLFYNFYNDEIGVEQVFIYIVIYSIYFLIGILDDIKTLSPKLRSLLIISSTIILILFESDFNISNLNFKSINSIENLNYFSYLFTIFCIFALYNALNFIDGYNGSATSIILFWCLFLLIKNPNIFYLMVLLISALIFIYNLSGKIFLGNSGTSLFSIFFALSIISEHNNNNLYADEILLLLLFPGIDMIRVTAQRILNRKKIYNPDKTHFHHYLIYAEIKYIWQIILSLTILPIFLFSFINNLFICLFSTILIYILFFNFIKKYHV